MKAAPHFAILGAQKSASTLLHRCLRQHPAVHMPGSETELFEDPFYDEARADAWMAEQERIAAGRIWGFKRADLLGRPECPARLRHHAPESLLLALLRDPVERLISAYYWYMKMAYIPVLPPEEGLRKVLDGTWNDTYPHAGELLSYGEYGAALARYREHFPEEQIKVWFFEEQRADMAAWVAEVYALLGIDTTFATKALHERPKQSVYNLTRIRIFRQPPFHRLWIEYCPGSREWWTFKGMRANARWLAKAGVIVTERHLLRRFLPDRKPVIPAGLREELATFYAPDATRLSTLLGRPLPAWPSAVAAGVATEAGAVR